MCHHPSVSLNKEKVSREISENKVCEKTQGLRSGNFSDLNSACSTVLVPVKIFQFQDMHYENRFLGTFQGHSKRPIMNISSLLHVQQNILKTQTVYKMLCKNIFISLPNISHPLSL